MIKENSYDTLMEFTRTMSWRIFCYISHPYALLPVAVLQFEENERKRMKAEIVRQELKHKKQWDELKSVNIANEKELEQIQVK